MKLKVAAAIFLMVSLFPGAIIHRQESGPLQSQPAPLSSGRLVNFHSEEEQNSAAPAFAARDLDGNWVRLDDFKGKVVVLKFWATWCPSCRNDMPEIEALHQQYAKAGLVVLAVDFQENAADVRAFFSDHKLSFAGLLDPKAEIFELYDSRWLPTTIIIDKRGKVVNKNVGSRDWRSVQSKVLLARLLQEPA